MRSKPAARNSIRIIGGELRSRRVEFTDSDGLRPTGDRVRETLFNWLQDEIAGASCLDLFAGSGVLGFEALSRGAKSVDLVEADRRVAAAIRDNATKLQLDKASVINMTAESWLKKKTGQGSSYDIAFIDPPFGMGRLREICAELDTSQVMNDGALVYVESDKPISAETVPENWQQCKTRKAGQVFFFLYRLDKTGLTAKSDTGHL